MDLMINKISRTALIALTFLFTSSFMVLPAFGFSETGLETAQTSGIALTSLDRNQAYDVGELGSAWQFPSDHLPVGLTVGSFNIALWNTLNKNYLVYIESNTQGLRDSSILKDNVQFDTANPLTKRELLIASQILEMIIHTTHPRSLIALEEVNPDLMNFLSQHLPSNWKIVTPLDQPLSQDLFLYDTAMFDYISLDTVLYSDTAPKSIFTLTLQEKATGKSFRFIQSHMPGGPQSEEGGEKFSAEALRQFDPNMTIVLMGDMNQSPKAIHEYLTAASAKMGLPESPYIYFPIDYPSHISTHMQAIWIDNFFVYSADPQLKVQGSNHPEEVTSQIVSIVQLLNNLK